MTLKYPDARKPPMISVVIPAYNEEQWLPDCLNSLKKQDFQHGFEIIVVDNDSFDGTSQVARKFGARVLHETKRGPASARQCGVEAAQGGIIAFLDADSTAPSNWLTRIYQHFSEHPKTVVVSAPYVFKDTNFIARLFSSVFSFLGLNLDHYFRKLCRKGGALWGSNFAVRKNAFDQAGGFDTSIKFYGEDYELSLRLHKIGKADILPLLFIGTSARRVRRLGFFTQYWNWIINYFSVLFFQRVISPSLEDFPSKFKRRIVFILNQKTRVILGFFICLSLIIWLHYIWLPDILAWIFYGTFSLAVLSFLIFHGINPRSDMYGRVYWQLPDNEKIVALTFDDGPNPNSTQEVLHILANYKIKATFFVTGRAATLHPSLCREIVVQGHTIANHSYKHDRWLCLKSNRRIRHDTQQAAAAISSATGISTSLYRPPHGFRSPRSMKILRNLGYKVITWGIMTNDWEAEKPSSQIFSDITRRIHPGDIIVLHDGRSKYQGYDRRQMLTALPLIISSIQSRDYRFVTVSEIFSSLDTCEKAHQQEAILHTE